MKALRRIRLGCLEGALGALQALARARARGRADLEPAHLRVGKRGERAAYFHLRRQGYVVVAERWSAGTLPGDLDLVAWQGKMLCICEVKTRTAHDATPAEAAVNEHKRQILRRLASSYLRRLPPATPVRFDLICVYLVPGEKEEVQHFEDAFGWIRRR